MYYFGTNLDNRFHVPDFWPSQEQGHRIPYERDEIREEVKRIARETREKQIRKELEDLKLGGGVMRRGDRDEDGDGGTDVKS